MSPLLEVRDLRKHFPVRASLLGRSRSYVHALDGVSFDMHEGETLGVVGESGSGKSTLGRTIIRLEAPTAGTVRFQGLEASASGGASRRALSQGIQMIFQDPYASLNPRLTVGHAIAEPLRIHGICASAAERNREVGRILELVGLQPSMGSLYPHAFSGGQRQRIGIARALSLRPRMLICDEAVSALDVSVQSQVLNLFNRLKRELNLTYLFIAHDLSVVRYVSDRIMVMYMGQVVELAPKRRLFERKFHPYTEALVSASPEVSTRSRKERIILAGEVPSAIDPPGGCRFHTRCVKRMGVCSRSMPELTEIEPMHFVRCHLYGQG
jgi:oligopeptide/dipeptide ABC transporter ATP-binding protein